MIPFALGPGGVELGVLWGGMVIFSPLGCDASFRSVSLGILLCVCIRGRICLMVCWLFQQIGGARMVCTWEVTSLECWL